MWQSHHPRRLAGGARAVHWLLIFLHMFTYADAQMPSVQQIHFVPKTYFMHQQQSPSESSASEPVAAESSFIEHSSTQTVDITRTPRHLAPDRYYVGPSSSREESDLSSTATTSLRANALDRAGNPINFNDNLDQELKLDISGSSNPHNNHYEAKILPNSHSQSVAPRKSSRGKSRRTKSRPPKNVIIYSLPEQSFYATPSNSEETSYSEPDSRENNGLRSDLGDEGQQQQQEQQQQQQANSVADSKEFRTSTSNLLSQKKALLGQCLAQCLEAIL